MSRAGRTRHRFAGQIAGVGSSSGVRVVVGHWPCSPLGPFADVMVAEADGTRVLLAPDPAVADFVALTYRFDRVVIGPVAVQVSGGAWRVEGPELSLQLDLGRRTPLGRLLRLVPRRLATAPWWSGLTDPVARVALRGVRTRGSAGHGRREFYGATDLHAVTGLVGRWRGHELGTLAPVAPEPGFGFGSTPERPSVTAVTTTVEVPDSRA
ncbi:hypothetical protein [Nocardioides aurantiacus]|uniref:Uncharacterized protein n=1 Tax=Nocardioides aurantiacus TaxID=86796 RepID=A0A3N2CUP7_9ACTN|nr:hypothetical protein [Nocardioides aurantiacus]ROR91265.1 hypothetical protein EDD33_2131 [Nocardioides aurantiacus]